MRIIAGNYAKRNLFTLKSDKTRPTSDKVKESVFNSLGQFFAGGQVLDLYAGSGALGIEAVSRGMATAVLVDIAKPAVEIIKKNIALTKEPEKFEVLQKADFTALKILAAQGRKFSLVFLDPPYRKQQNAKVMQELVKLELLNSGAQVVVESDDETPVDEVLGLTLAKEHRYGHTIVRYYVKD